MNIATGANSEVGSNTLQVVGWSFMIDVKEIYVALRVRREVESTLWQHNEGLTCCIQALASL